MGSTLLIEGMSIIPGNMFSDMLLNSDSFQNKSVSRIDYTTDGPHAVQTELQSGKYGACILADLSYNQGAFVREIGPSLKEFTRRGGRVAFTTCEGLNLNAVLRAIYAVPWERGSYYRTTWGVRDANKHMVNTIFPGLSPAAGAQKYSAKACSFMKVPSSDRCFGVIAESKHESLSMLLAGFQNAAPEGQGTHAEPEGRSEDSAVCIATRMYGVGRICYFGDVNFSDPTIDLVAAFIFVDGPIIPSFELEHDTPVTQTPICQMCAASVSVDGQHPLKRCAACRSVWYCTRECQREDWDNHKPSCRRHDAS